MSIPDPFKGISKRPATGRGQTPRHPVPPAYAALCEKAQQNGHRVLLYAANGTLAELAIAEGNRPITRIPMGPPRPLTLEQAARQLLR